jgi:vesicle coat complex subunit
VVKNSGSKKIIEDPVQAANPDADKLIAYTVPRNNSIDANLIPEVSTPSIDVSHKENLNNLVVTSTSPERTTGIGTQTNKGSVRGLLRKATRLIEKRTGIDPTNDDGELLIGAVALRLK